MPAAVAATASARSVPKLRTAVTIMRLSTPVRARASSIPAATPSSRSAYGMPAAAAWSGETVIST